MSILASVIAVALLLADNVVLAAQGTNNLPTFRSHPVRAFASAGILRPLPDDNGRLDTLLRGHTAFWLLKKKKKKPIMRMAIGGALLEALNQSSPQLPQSHPLDPYAGACPAAAQHALDAIDAAFGASTQFTSQHGTVDWGLVDGDDTQCNNAANGCGANNPSGMGERRRRLRVHMLVCDWGNFHPNWGYCPCLTPLHSMRRFHPPPAPYGLVVLPLAPEEVRKGK